MHVGCAPIRFTGIYVRSNNVPLRLYNYSSVRCLIIAPSLLYPFALFPVAGKYTTRYAALPNEPLFICLPVILSKLLASGRKSCVLTDVYSKQYLPTRLHMYPRISSAYVQNYLLYLILAHQTSLPGLPRFNFQAGHA